MKPSTTPWTTVLAAVAFLALPVAGRAQTTPPTQPPTTQPPATQPPATQPPATAPPTIVATPAEPQTQTASAQEHLRDAKAALDSISNTAVTGRARLPLSELKRHINALENASGANSPATTTSAARRSTRGTSGNVVWSTEVAAIDGLLTNLLGPASTTGATTGTSAPAGTSGRTASTVILDEATRGKLMQVRTHIIAYAAAMSGTATSPEPAPATSATTGAATDLATTSATEPAKGAEAQKATAPQVDTEAARRHLTEAKDTLTQLTQLPAAAQLSGEPRVVVSQLISNFNELINKPTDWRSTYAKVASNLTALLGPDNTDAEAAGGVSTATTGTTGTTGVTGSSGTAPGIASLDPAIRAKLVDLRRQLNGFAKASGQVLE